MTATHDKGPTGFDAAESAESPMTDARQKRVAWEAYRATCFLRTGPALIWVWSAKHDFDLAPAGLHLEQLPGARIEMGTHAVALVLPHLGDRELHEWHLVPLTRLTANSLDALQPAAAHDLRLRAAELSAEQLTAQTRLTELTSQAHLWRLHGGTSGGAAH